MSEDSNSFPICRNCGTKSNHANPKFCSTCGTRFGLSDSQMPDKDVRDQSQSPDIKQRKENEQVSPPSYIAKSPGQTGTGPSAPFQQGPAAFSQQSSQKQQQEGYGQSPYDQQQQQQGMYASPRDIQPVSGSIYTKEELITIGIFSLMGYISHIMRYFLYFNSAPSLIGFVFPIPLYILAVGFVYTIQKYILRNKGMQPVIGTTKFDYTLSLVFSTFFLTFLPSRFRIDREQSTIPDQVSTPVDGQYGASYQKMSREQYIGSQIRPYLYMMTSFLVGLLGAVSIYLYFNVSTPVYYTTFQLLSAYLGGFVIVELAPIFGRHNSESSEYGKYRTLGIFIIGLLISVSALLGQSFFTALLNRT